MANSVTLKIAGLHTFNDHLSAVPPGALLKARNIVIDRENVAESRRGFKVYGTSMSSLAHQLLTYKGVVLRHYGSSKGTTLEYDNGSGTFSTFNFSLTSNTNSSKTITNISPNTTQLEVGMLVSGIDIPVNTTITSIDSNTQIKISNTATGTHVGTSLTFSWNISEVDAGLRIKSIEQNGNLYFTTDNGIRKISTSSTIGANPIITRAGGIKALDLELRLDYTSTPFLISPLKKTFVGDVLPPNRSASISAVTKANPAVVTSVGHGLSTGNVVIITGCDAPLVNGTFSITVLTADTFSVPVDNSGGAVGTTGTWSLRQGTAITNISVDNPTKITATNHKLISGDTIVISGSGSTPSIDGVRIVTVIDKNTFTIPVNVTVAGTTGVWYKATPNTNYIFNIPDTSSLTAGYPITNTVIPPKTTILAIEDNNTVKISNDVTSSSIGATFTASPYAVTAYRLVWGTKDSNSNLILGAPSSIGVIRNTNIEASAAVSIKSVIPRGITSSYFYQIYRTAVFSDVDGTQDPGDEQQLVYEGTLDATDFTAGYITYVDSTPDTFRNTSSYLYTNQNSGEGILQANDIPPLAKDIAAFKGYTLYSNTSTLQRLNLQMLPISNLVSGTSKITITDGTSTTDYTFKTQDITCNIAGNTTVSGFTVSNYNLYVGQYISDVPGTITNISVASPTVITSNSHGLTTGDTITISGSNSTPSIDGVYTVTVTGLNTFTIPVNVTVMGTSGSYSANFQLGTYITAINSTTNEITISQNAKRTKTGVKFRIGQEDTGSNRYVAISQAPNFLQSVQIDETARSLVKVINNQFSEIAYAYYISTSNTVPGQIFLEAKRPGQIQFWVTVNDAVTTGITFSPNLSTTQTTQSSSSNETQPNRIYYSKYQQPETVPLLNYIDVGPKDKAILRILALRDNVFIFKEDGVYRLSGISTPFSIYPFDFSVILKGPDSAVVLNNLIYVASSQGISKVSDTGVEVISRPIEDQITKLFNYVGYSKATFGVSYETDRSYYLFTVKSTSDTVATQCIRYNTFTNTFTILDISKTCGVVNSSDDKLYLGASDINYIEQERKSYSRVDYSDREYTITLGNNSISSTTITLPSLTNVAVGDTIFQTQYLTIKQFNQLLTKLDNDSLLFNSDYYDTYKGTSGVDLSSKLDGVITALASDVGRLAVTGCFPAIAYTGGSGLITNISVANPTSITSANHGLVSGMTVTISGSNSTPSVDGTYSITVTGANTFTIPVNVTVLGNAGTWACGLTPTPSTFSGQQTTFNSLIDTLIADPGIGYKQFLYSAETVDYEFNIVSINSRTISIESPYEYPLIKGDVILYKAIPTELQWVPQYFQDVSMTKQLMEGTLIFEDAGFSSATLSYASDLSGNFEAQEVNGTGNNTFGNYSYGNGIYGGTGSGVPFRTYIPKEKSRCRYLNVAFSHSIAREVYSLYGMTLVYNLISNRGYR